MQYKEIGKTAGVKNVYDVDIFIIHAYFCPTNVHRNEECGKKN